MGIRFLLTLFLFSGGMSGCSNPDRLRDYLMNIPEKEEINASLYHYEIIADGAQREFSNQNYYGVLSLYERYLTVFFDSTIPNDEKLLYWVGRSVKEIVGEGLDPNDREGDALFTYLQEVKERKNYLGIEFEGEYSSNQNRVIRPDSLLYQGKHFIMILDQRADYSWEKTALREVYNTKFLSPGKESLNQNLDHGYWLITRYPDLFPPQEYRSILTQFIDPDAIPQLSKSRREKWARIQEILRVNTWVMTDPHAFSQICFPEYAPIVIYNRTHWISSRNLTSLSIWQPFKVNPERSQVLGEDGQTWYAVIFEKDRRGFIDEVNFTESCERKWDPQSPTVKKYLLAYQYYLSQDYLTAEKIMAELLYDLQGGPDPDMQLLSRSWTLFYQILKEIALRSTSLDNPFTRFAQEYSDYFRVSRDQVNLEVSDYFLKKIIEYDQDSPMLQYFDGFN